MDKEETTKRINERIKIVLAVADDALSQFGVANKIN